MMEIAVDDPTLEPINGKGGKHFEKRLAASKAALESHRANQTLPVAFAPANEYLPVDRMRDCLQQAWASAYNTPRWPRRLLRPLAMPYLCPARPGDYLASNSSSC